MPARSRAGLLGRAVPAAALLVAVLPAGGPPAHAAPAWLEHLNSYRVRMGLAPVTQDPRLAAGIDNHSRYIVKTDDYDHSEDPSSSYYTASGNTAGNRSNITVRAGGAGTPIDDVEQWLRAPFHALGMLHPGLRATEYDSYYEARSPGYTYAAGIDVLTHRSAPADAAYPIAFPAAHMVLPVTMTTAADEVPDPLAPCGYSGTAGLPLIFTFGTAVRRPVLTDSSLTRDGVPVEACATTADSYGDRTARAILAESNSVLLIPRAPLVPGRAYTASVTVSGVTERVSFSVERAAASIAADVTAAEIDCGGSTEVIARLVPGHGSAARQPLQLWARPADGSRPWQWIRSGTTDSAGRAGFDGLSPSADTDYQVRYAGNVGNLPARSAVRSVSVVRRPWTVAVDGPRDRVLVQASSTELTGQALGGRAELLLERQEVNGRWVDAEVAATANDAGYFRISVPLGRSERVSFRVVALAAGCHLVGHSDPVTVTVLVASTP